MGSLSVSFYINFHGTPLLYSIYTTLIPLQSSPIYITKKYSYHFGWGKLCIDLRGKFFVVVYRVERDEYFMSDYVKIVSLLLLKVKS